MHYSDPAFFALRRKAEKLLPKVALALLGTSAALALLSDPFGVGTMNKLKDTLLPMLFLHGNEDQIAPVSQAVQARLVFWRWQQRSNSPNHS